MFDPDDLPPPKPALRNLETMSMGELAGYVEELEGEIARVEAELKKKEAHANAASSLFKAP